MEKEIKQARLTIFEAPTMNGCDKKRLVNWLRITADSIEKEKDHEVYIKNPRWTLYK